MYVCILSLLISLLINIVLSTPPNTPWPPQSTTGSYSTVHRYQFKANALTIYGVPWKCANVPLTMHMSPHLATVEKLQHRKPPEEEQNRNLMRSMPNTCHLSCTPFWSTVRHKKQAMYEKKREQMREQENIERLQPLVLNGVTLKLQSVRIKIKPSDKPVTIPKVPVFHCDACLGDWQLTCSLQEVTRQLLVMKVLNLFLDHAIIHAYVYCGFEIVK